MLAFAAGQRPIGDLVPLEAGVFEGGRNHFIAPGQHVFIRGGQQPLIDLAGHASAVFHDKRVRADVVDAGLEHAVQGLADVIVGFGGRTVNHVEVDVLEAGRAGLARGGKGASGGVGALEHLEHAVRGGLHAEADAVKAGIGKRGKVLRRGGLRVGLGGDLGAWAKPKGRAHRIQDAAQALPAQERGRAATDEDRIRGAPHAASRHLQLLVQGIEVRAGEIARAAQLAGGIGIEIAIAATGGAKGNVDIQPEWFSHESNPNRRGTKWPKWVLNM